MSKKLKQQTVCIECGKLIKRASNGTDAMCQICNEFKNSTNIDFNKSFEVKLDTPGQKLAAIDTVGEAFRHHGGSTLMLTEHIENGIDAIEDLVYSKNLVDYNGEITITIDKINSRIIITDNGTGILEPIWIMEHPLKSRKKGVSNQHGEFGRGLQGFRGFCQKLEYITLRGKISDKELEDSEINEYIKKSQRIGINGNCLKLTLSKDTVVTNYKPISYEEFKKFSKHACGTVAIFSEWLPGDFEELTKNKKKLFERVQHHFRVPLEKGTVQIFLIDGKDTEAIAPREFEAKNEEGQMEELDLYEIPSRKIIHPYTKQEFGTLEVKFYKASPNYNHTYKSPFLLVGDRPLGNSVLIDMEYFSDKRILKSPYVTGYVIANFLNPDSLRLSPKPGEELNMFKMHLRDILDTELAPQLKKYEAGFRDYSKRDENTKLILQVQSFLKNNMDIDLKLLEINKIGSLFPGTKMGENSSERISNIEGGENQGVISKDGKIEAVILYKKQKKKKIKTTDTKTSDHTDDVTTPVKRYRITVPTDDGKSTTTVLINPNLTSKDGRIKKQEFTGPGLDNYRGKYDRNMSKWDDSNYMVLINESHPIYEDYEKKHQESKDRVELYSSKQKNLIQESYLWHLIQNCAKDMDKNTKDRVFWEAKYKFFLNREE